MIFIFYQYNSINNFAPLDFERSRLAENFKEYRSISPHTSAEKRYIVPALKGTVRETEGLIVYQFIPDFPRHVTNKSDKIKMQDDIFPAAEKILSDIENVVKKNPSL